MTFINHGFTMLALIALITQNWLVLLAAFMWGTIPDTLDWSIYMLSKQSWMRWLFTRPLERWGLTYRWFHTSKLGHILGFPHVWFDHLIHDPVLPRKGENAFMDEVLVTEPIKLTRHDIIWLTGEAMLFLFGLTLLLIRLSLCV